MRKSHDVSSVEGEYLRSKYGKIAFTSPLIEAFLNEIFSIMAEKIEFSSNHSLLDIGCGRGYVVKYLEAKGFTKIRGIDPCAELLSEKLSTRIEFGSFENNSIPSNSVDVAFTCHTLHHLSRPLPHKALAELTRISKKYIVVVEINNTNIPMFFVSLLNRKVERNAMFYNLMKVQRMLQHNGLKVIYCGNLDSIYISGDSFLYRIAYAIGSKPYNICIAEK